MKPLSLKQNSNTLVSYTYAVQVDLEIVFAFLHRTGRPCLLLPVDLNPLSQVNNLVISYHSSLPLVAGSLC